MLEEVQEPGSDLQSDTFSQAVVLVVMSVSLDTESSPKDVRHAVVSSANDEMMESSSRSGMTSARHCLVVLGYVPDRSLASSLLTAFCRSSPSSS